CYPVAGCPTTIRYPVPGKVCACVIGCGVCINWTSIAPALESSTVLTFVHESDGGFGVDDNDVDDGGRFVPLPLEADPYAAIR
ncbi:hypothetical protein VIGAN_01188500, partial [Vigna angularis var. angularis]